MEQIIGRRSKYNGYSPVISNAKHMHLEKSDLDDKEILAIDVYEEDRQEVDDFIWQFDATYGDETAPLPLPMRFRYRIISQTRRDAIARLSKEIEADKKETKGLYKHKQEKEDERKCHLCDEPTTNKYCENEDCEVNQRDERGEKDDEETK